jgi:hypothetical protein
MKGFLMTQGIFFIENLELIFSVVQLNLHCRRILKSQFSTSKQASHILKTFLYTKWHGCLEMLANSL